MIFFWSIKQFCVVSNLVFSPIIYFFNVKLPTFWQKLLFFNVKKTLGADWTGLTHSLQVQVEFRLTQLELARVYKSSHWSLTSTWHIVRLFIFVNHVQINPLSGRWKLHNGSPILGVSAATHIIICCIALQILFFRTLHEHFVTTNLVIRVVTLILSENQDIKLVTRNLPDEGYVKTHALFSY